MTKLLKIKILSVALILLVTQPVKAQTSTEYYKSLFQLWGTPVDILIQDELQKSDAPATKRDLQKVLDQISGNTINNQDASKVEKKVIETLSEERYLLLLSSQKNLEVPPYRKIIIICNTVDLTDSSFPIPCTSNTIGNTNFAEINPLESSSSDRILKTIKPTVIGNITYYAIPQVLLITPEYQKGLGNYFKALSKAGASKYIPDTEDEEAESGLNERFRDSSLYESTLYILAILLFVIMSRGVLVTMVTRPKRLIERSFYFNILDHALTFLNKNSGTLLFNFTVLALFYIPIIYALHTKSRVIGDPSYTARYLLTTLNPSNVPSFLIERNIFRIGLMLYNFILIMFGFFLITPNIIAFFTESADKLMEVKIKTNFIKWLIPSIISINMFLLALTELRSLSGFISLSAAILLASLLYIRSRHINYASMFNKKELGIVTTGMILLLALNILYPLYKNSQPTKYTYEPLIGVKDTVVAFPYSKKWGKNVLFETHLYRGNSKVFADGFLVYAPNTQKIINKPLKDFAGEKSITLTSSNPNDTIEALLKKPELLSFVENNTFSPLFALNNTSNNVFNYNNIRAEITFNCNLTSTPSVVKLEILSLNEFESKSDPLNAGSTEILNFPGCSIRNGSETFEVPFNNYTIPQELVVLRLRGIEARVLLGIKLWAGTAELPIRFLNKEILNEDAYSLLYSSKDFSPEITSYSTKVEKEFTIEVKTTEDGFDISRPINDLVKQGRLQNPFIIWTTTQSELIEGN